MREIVAVSFHRSFRQAIGLFILRFIVRVRHKEKIKLDNFFMSFPIEDYAISHTLSFSSMA
jgi:hypothetical protein